VYILSNNFQIFIPERKYGIFKSSFVENNAWIITNYLCPIRSNAWILTNFLYPIFSDISKSCHERQWIDENETFVITFTHWNLNLETELLSNQFSSSCQLFITKPELRLSATILYQPEEHDCHHGYLSIGNDKYRPDIVSMTSFQFCENLDNFEIVSRSNTLWVVNKRRFGYQIEGQIKIQSRPPGN
jgi:hypothetical protein